MSKLHVHFLKMGGTIEFHDPAYEEINKTLLRLDTTIDSYLKHIIKPHFDYSIEEICDKDSRDITDQDLEDLYEAIVSTSHSNILITHGTFTMQESARFLTEKKIAEKKIVFTGSMIPISGFSTSDAGFNLGFVLGSFASINPGVYLSMNGGMFNADEVQKNPDKFRFE